MNNLKPAVVQIVQLNHYRITFVMPRIQTHEIEVYKPIIPPTKPVKRSIHTV